MKKLKIRSFAVLVGIVTLNFGAFADPAALPPAAPQIEKGSSGIGPWNPKDGPKPTGPTRHAQPQTDSTDFVAGDHQYLVAASGSAFQQAITNIIAAEMSGTIPIGTNIFSPSDFIWARGSMTKGSMTSSADDNFFVWDGTNVTSGVFAGQPGLILISCISGESKSGNDSVSLSDLMTIQTSTKDNNYLGATNTYIGSYSQTAWLQTSDGKIHTDGATTVPGKKVVTYSILDHFLVKNQTDINTVDSWVSFYKPYTLTHSTMMAGVPSTATSATAVVGATRARIGVALTISTSNGNVIVDVTNKVAGTTYSIERSSTVNGSYLPAGTAPYSVEVGAPGAGFFRGFAQ